MDFSHGQGFNAQKAGGIAAVALAHIILGAALVYCLHSTIISVENKGPIVVESEAPTPKKPNEPLKFDSEPGKHMVTIDLPPVEKVPEHTPYVAPQTEPLGQPPGSGNMTGEGGIDGDGPGVKPAGHTSNPVIARLNECKPEYPAAAIREEEEGTVQLRLDMGANGQLLDASVQQSSGHADLGRAAIRGLSRCSFRAATQDGAPVQSSLVTDYVWSLRR